VRRLGNPEGASALGAAVIYGRRTKKISQRVARHVSIETWRAIVLYREIAIMFTLQHLMQMCTSKCG